jgi:hypothetical protein
MAQKHRLLITYGLIATLAVQPALGKIAKTAQVDCKTNRICFYWWPPLPSIPGWHTDAQTNYGVGDHGIYALIPDGSNFANADVIIYGRAVYKPSVDPKTRNLDAFIADDEEQFRKETNGDISIADAPPLQNANRQKLRSVTYFRPKDRSWERVTYSEENDNYVLFVLNAHSLEAYKAAQATYEALIEAYKP